MIQRKANSYRLYPDAGQRETLARIAGACRMVYNLALEQRRDWWQRYRDRTGQAISFAGQCRELTALRQEVDWLREAPIHPLQQALRDLNRAYQNFFSGRTGYPTPRRKGLHDSFRFPDPTSLRVERTGKRTGRIKLPKLGWVAFRGWYDLPGAIRNITLSRRAGQWFASVQWERDCAEPAPSVQPAVGLDMGVSVFAATRYRRADCSRRFREEGAACSTESATGCLPKEEGQRQQAQGHPARADPARSRRQCPKGFPPQTQHDHRQEPRHGCCGGIARAEHVRVGKRHGRRAGSQRPAEVRAEQEYSGSGMADVSHVFGLQAGRTWRETG